MLILRLSMVVHRCMVLFAGGFRNCVKLLVQGKDIDINATNEADEHYCNDLEKMVRLNV